VRRLHLILPPAEGFFAEVFSLFHVDFSVCVRIAADGKLLYAGFAKLQIATAAQEFFVKCS
jgi:hypothetical protein